MPLNFPNSPSLNQIYTSGSNSWQWDGTLWNAFSSSSVGPIGPAGVTGATGATGSFNTTIQTIDFSSVINELQFDVFNYTSDYIGTPLYAFASKANIQQLNGLTATIQNAGQTMQIVGTVENVETYRINPMPTNIDYYHTITFKPPFYGATSGVTYTAEEVSVLNVTEITTSSWNSVFDPVGITGSISLFHKEGTYTIKSITGQSWVAADTFITCKILGLTTEDHDPEDAILEGIKFEINNVVPGTGFDIIGHAPEGTYGKYKIKCLGQ
jgi:hypothetical protein